MNILKNIGIALLAIIGAILALIGLRPKKGNEKIQKLREEADKIEKDIKVIEAKEEKLKNDGVEEMTSIEAAEYWKDQ